MSPLTLRQPGPVAYYVFEALEPLDFLCHAFSTRRGGVSPLPDRALNLGYIEEDTPENVQYNRSQFLAAIGQGGAGLRTLHQVHSDQIHILNNEAAKTKPFLLATGGPADPQRVGEGDGLVTDRTGLLLGVQTADCLPILLIDPRRRAVANLHAGWRGTHRRIAAGGVRVLAQAYGSRSADLIAAIGPGIGACCYEVGGEVVEAFRREFSYAEDCLTPPNAAGRRHLDLATANRLQLTEAGVPSGQVLSAGRCTACEPEWFFSYRREGGRTGRLLAVVGLRPTDRP